MNKTLYSDSFDIIPIDGPGMQWPVSVAFAKRDGALRDAVNGALDRIAGKIADLKVKYGFPAAEPITLAEGPAPAKTSEQSPSEAPAPAKSAEQAVSEAPAPAKADEHFSAGSSDAKSSEKAVTGAPAPAQSDGAPAAAADAPKSTVESAALTPSPEPAASSDEDRVREGKEVFNGTCAHCHGPNAEQAERKIDLRLLHHRYKESMEEMFFKTVRNGRPAKGMPSWKDVFTQEQFVSILAFLKTVQAD